MQARLGLVLMLLGLLWAGWAVFWSDVAVNRLILEHPYCFIADFLMVVMGTMMVVIAAEKASEEKTIEDW